MGAANSVSIGTGKKNYRALVDTGEVSVVNSSVFYALRHAPELRKEAVNLRTANGSSLEVEGVARLRMRIGGYSIYQDFFVVKNLNRSVILGRDWLSQNGVRMYFDLGAIKLGNEYIALEEDARISALVRLAGKITLRPQHLHTCMAQVGFKNGQGLEYEIEQISSGYVSKLSGISVANSVVRINKSRRLPLMIMNNTNQTVTLRRGCPIARCSVGGSITEITMPEKHMRKESDKTVKGVKVPEEFKSEVDKVLERNKDLFVTEDKDLGRTNTVEMRIDTGTHEPIRKCPYRTPLKQRKEVELALEEMMRAGIIERSNSPWSFPIVLVEKKDGSKRFCVDFRALNKVTKKYARA